jgi:hypothetical protein
VTQKVAYLKWRGGRPRWEPGPRLRESGWRGRDLKDENGQWLDRARAQYEAMQINNSVAIWRAANFTGTTIRRQPQQRSARRARGRDGYVYFIATPCRRFVKIGFSTMPGARLAQINGNTPEKCTMIGCVPATRSYERTMHRVFEEHRHNGEWFNLAPEITEHIRRMGGEVATADTETT